MLRCNEQPNRTGCVGKERERDGRAGKCIIEQNQKEIQVEEMGKGTKKTKLLDVAAATTALRG